MQNIIDFIIPFRDSKEKDIKTHKKINIKINQSQPTQQKHLKNNKHMENVK